MDDISASHITTFGSTLILGGSKLLFVDGSDPWAPAIISEIEIAVDGDFYIQDNFLFIKNRQYLRVADISSIESPVLLETGYAPGGESVHFFGSEILVFSEDNGNDRTSSIYKVNVFDPLRPFISSFLDLEMNSGDTLCFNESGDLFAVGSNSGPFSGGIYIIGNSPQGPLSLRDRIMSSLPIIGGPLHFLDMDWQENTVYFLAEEGIGSFSVARYQGE